VTAQPVSTPSTDGTQRGGVHHVTSGGRDEYHAGGVGGGGGGGGVGEDHAGAEGGGGEGDGEGGGGETRAAGIHG